MSMSQSITTREARRAIYIDFEGTQAEPACLLGVLTPDDEFVQFVMDPVLRTASDARSKLAGRGHCARATLDEAVDYIAGRLRDGSVVAAWSRHDADVITKFATESAAKDLVLAQYRNAKQTARRWKKRCHPSIKWKKVPFQPTYSLDRFMKLVGYVVPKAHGPGNTGQRLRYVKAQLLKRGCFDALTPTAKGKWTRLLGHNYHDCFGLRAVTQVAATGGSRPAGRRRRRRRRPASGDCRVVAHAR